MRLWGALDPRLLLRRGRRRRLLPLGRGSQKHQRFAAVWLAVMGVAIQAKTPLYVVMRMDDTQPKYEATTQVK